MSGLVFGQEAYRVRFDWGPLGADAVAPGAACVAVVDVLSFTTTLTVAVEKGLSVLPYPWRDGSAAEVARRNGAMLAVLRKESGPGRITLSPESILRAELGTADRLVLPSPNGSAISARLASAGVTVVGVSLRNAEAAANWVRAHAGDRPVGVIAAGERWPDGSLRPAVEDLWGAGAFLAALVNGANSAGTNGAYSAGTNGASGTGGGGGAGPGGSGRVLDGLSPEAMAALAAYQGMDGLVGDALRETASGRELRAYGFEGDVEVAGAVGASPVVPVLAGGWFVNGISGLDGGS